jgi:hypothetical protein
MDGDVIMEPTESNLSKAEKLEIWREAMTQLRYLNDEAWKRFQFFLWFEFLLSISTIGVARHSRIGFVALFLCAAFVLVVARYILKRNRTYYLQMLLKKTLLEDELGFYREKFPDTETDLAFPWRLTPEVVAELKKDPDGWIRKSIRGKGTIAQWQFVIYEIWMALYGLSLLVIVLKVASGR